MIRKTLALLTCNDLLNLPGYVQLKKQLHFNDENWKKYRVINNTSFAKYMSVFIVFITTLDIQ